MKTLLRIAAIVSVCALLAFGAALLFLNQLLEYAVEKDGSRVLGAPTRVDAVRLQPLNATLDVRGLQIDNPPGFDEPPFFSMGRGHLRLDLASLRGDRIVVPRLDIEGVGVHLQRKDGATNYAMILDQLASDPGQTGGGEETESDGVGLLIQELRIADVKARAALVPRTGRLTAVDVEVPEIRLVNLTSESAGDAIFGEISAIVVRAVLEAIVKRSGKLPLTLTRDLTSRLGAIPRPLSSITDAVGLTQERSAEGAERLLEGSGKRLEDAASKLLGGFGRTEKPDAD